MCDGRVGLLAGDYSGSFMVNPYKFLLDDLERS